MKYFIFPQIRWQPIIWGICMQFILGVVVLRWKPGYIALKWITDQFNQFLMYSLAGAAMAFGDPMFILHPFLMMVSNLVRVHGNMQCSKGVCGYPPPQSLHRTLAFVLSKGTQGWSPKDPPNIKMSSINLFRLLSITMK